MTLIKNFNEGTDELLKLFPQFTPPLLEIFNQNQECFRGCFLHRLRRINNASFALLIQHKPRLAEAVF